MARSPHRTLEPIHSTFSNQGRSKRNNPVKTCFRWDKPTASGPGLRCAQSQPAGVDRPLQIGIDGRLSITKTSPERGGLKRLKSSATRRRASKSDLHKSADQAISQIDVTGPATARRNSNTLLARCNRKINRGRCNSESSNRNEPLSEKGRCTFTISR